jgi:RES domain-containing protein
MIYTSEHFSTAMLEKLAHGSGRVPPNQHYIEVTIPSGLSYEMLDEPSLPGWAAEDTTASRLYGDKWQQQRRSLILIVPSVVARVDKNILINPSHAEFGPITHSLHHPVWWDNRLFGS